LEEVLDAATGRLHQAGLGARTITVRLRDGQFSTIGRSVSLTQASNEPGELRAAAVIALAASVEAMGLDADEESGVGARLLGVSFGALSPATQLSLLPAGDSSPQSAATGDTRSDLRSVEAATLTDVSGCPGKMSSTPHWAAGGSCGWWTPRRHHPGRRRSRCVSKSPGHGQHGNDDSPPTMPS